jgi:putative tricarboxylic transport membrane protein
VLSVIGTYSVSNSLFDVWLLAGFGLLGYVLRKLDIPAAPLLLAFVLGPLAENAIRQSLVLSDNSLAIFVQRPIAATLLAAAALAVASLLLSQARTTRRQLIEVEQ